MTWQLQTLALNNEGNCATSSMKVPNDGALWYTKIRWFKVEKSRILFSIILISKGFAVEWEDKVIGCGEWDDDKENFVGIDL